MLTWGTLNNPTLLESSFSATSDQVANQQDYGHMLKVGDQETRVMTSDEWDYLMPDKAIPGWLPHNNRVWREDGVTAGNGQDVILKHYMNSVMTSLYGCVVVLSSLMI